MIHVNGGYLRPPPSALLIHASLRLGLFRVLTIDRAVIFLVLRPKLVYWALVLCGRGAESLILFFIDKQWSLWRIKYFQRRRKEQWRPLPRLRCWRIFMDKISILQERWKHNCPYSGDCLSRTRDKNAMNEEASHNGKEVPHGGKEID